MRLLPLFGTPPLPRLSGFPLKAYAVNFALDHLTPGVDNVRSDVRLSPRFLETTRRIVFQLVVKHAKADEHDLEIDAPGNWNALKQEFEWVYSDVILGAVFKAKSADEVQIDYLAQTAIVKTIIEEIRNQCDELVQRYKLAIRRYEIRDDPHFSEPLRLKEKMGKIIQQQETIRRTVGRELFMLLADIQRKDLKQIREIHFGVESALHHDVFTNPLLQADDPSDPFFLIEEYGVLPGRYPEDPDTLPRLMGLLRDTLLTLEMPAEKSPHHATTVLQLAPPTIERQIDAWLKQVDNIDLLFNAFQSEYRRKLLHKQGGAPRKLDALKLQQQSQEAALDLVWHQFHKAGLIPRIAALEEIRPIIRDYCPPLPPRMVLEYMINPRSRRAVADRLRKLESLQATRYPLAPLRQKVLKLRSLSRKSQKKLLTVFLPNLVRYQRDLDNLNMLREAMGSVNLATKDTLIGLSRANNTLYEFLLPQEIELEEKAVLHHVVIKADLRGSTEIAAQLKNRGLNPASYFSLNFFGPITRALAEYGARKVFIEGDAIILSIEEQAETPEGWYSVARACGLAVNILQIIRRHNAQTAKDRLPPLELGIGIAFQEGAPTYLLDGESRIMISPAINQADRLSGSARGLPDRLNRQRFPFCLYRFRASPAASCWWLHEEGILRYNVDGIELNASGFKKLRQEIDLKPLHLRLAAVPGEKHRFYSGRYPTVSGQSRPLVIREAHVPLISLPDLLVERISKEIYYEVCSQERLLKCVAAISDGQRREKKPGGDQKAAPHPGQDGAQ